MRHNKGIWFLCEICLVLGMHKSLKVNARQTVYWGLLILETFPFTAVCLSPRNHAATVPPVNLQHKLLPMELTNNPLQLKRSF